jgi:hypothetical protein
MRARVEDLLSRGMPLDQLAAIMRSASRAGEGGERVLHYVSKLVDLRDKGVKGVNQVLGSLAGGHGFFQGEEWVLRYIDRRGLWNSVESFEVAAERSGVRRWDTRIAGVNYQFKSWMQFYGDVFVEQILEDHRFTDRFTKPMKWVFDPGRGIGTLEEVHAAAVQAIRDAVPKSISEDVAEEIIDALPRILDIPDAAKVGRKGTVL